MTPPAATSRAEPDDLARLTRSERDGVVVARLVGEIDVSNAGGIEAELHSLPNEALGLVLDLSGTTFMDSSGVSLLYGLRERLRRRGQTLRVVAPPGTAPRRVLELTGYERAGPLDVELDGAAGAIRAAAGQADSSGAGG
jgi:anti-anti-sigma factor